MPDHQAAVFQGSWSSREPSRWRQHRPGVQAGCAPSVHRVCGLVVQAGCAELCREGVPACAGLSLRVCACACAHARAFPSPRPPLPQGKMCRGRHRASCPEGGQRPRVCAERDPRRPGVGVGVGGGVKPEVISAPETRRTRVFLPGPAESCSSRQEEVRVYCKQGSP